MKVEEIKNLHYDEIYQREFNPISNQDKVSLHCKGLANTHTAITLKALIEDRENYPTEYLPPDILAGFEMETDQLKQELKTLEEPFIEPYKTPPYSMDSDKLNE